MNYYTPDLYPEILKFYETENTPINGNAFAPLEGSNKYLCRPLSVELHVSLGGSTDSELVKSIISLGGSTGSIRGSYIIEQKGELWISNSFIKKYQNSSRIVI